MLGVQLVVQFGMADLARVFWWGAFALWFFLTYLIFAAITTKRDKPDLADGINGGWLTAVVATQSVVVLGTMTVPLAGRPEMVMLGLVSLWLAGGMLYIWMISLIFYRYTFFRFLPGDLMPPLGRACLAPPAVLYASPITPTPHGSAMDLAKPYLLFLGDVPDQLAAKTALGVVDWRPEWCLGQLRLG